ncbi:MAG: type II secretion system secretin GspD, partial [Methylococcales bacterium]|nr:type II secretion system secretin GspD [Methylococcales bacterium]
MSMVKTEAGHLLFLVTMTLLLVGCESFGPSLTGKLPLNPVAVVADENKQEHASLFTDLGLNAGAESRKQPTVEMYPGTGGFLIGQPKTGIPIKPPGVGEYTLNFDDADLGEVVKVILSDTLGENYMFSPKVSGRVTLQTTRALSRDELIPTLEILLRMNEAVLIQGKGGFRIEPTAQALTGVQSVKLGPLGQRVPTGYQLRVIPLRYIGVEEMQKILEPILPEKSVVLIDKTRNLMVLAGTGSELQNILETIEVFDVNLLKDMSVMIYPLQNVNAKTVIGELEQVFGHGPDEDNPLRGMFKVIPIERMNSVMVITPQPQYLKEARTWLERLDRSTADTGGSGGIYVYRVQNVTATTLADLLNALFSTGGKKAPPPAQLSPGRSAVSIGNMASAVAGAAGGTIKSSARQLSVGGHQDVRVIPDENNNSLVIVATAQAYKTLMDVIAKLDIAPLQVLINATIVEVDLTDSLEHGIQWFFKHGFAGIGMAETKFSANTKTSDLLSATNGFSYSITDSVGAVRAVLTALAEQNDVKVISSPSLMVLNNQEATINVGDQVPIATSSSTNTSGGGGGDMSPIVVQQIQMV